MAIAYKKQVDSDTEFALWRIEEKAEDLYKKLQLDEHEKAYVEKLSLGKRHLHWLAVRVLLRTMLNTDEFIDCKIDSHGKPYLVHLPYHISLSHSFDYAAVMMSRSAPVGIDIEQIREKVERIAYKFMQPAELAFIDGADPVKHLYAAWCVKEAVYKCFGEKEVSFADNISLEPFSFVCPGMVNAHLDKGKVHKDYRVDYLQYEDYMIGYVKG
ncbi:MAG: 4'-phosphopantetheinyl transferase superfamily protein [Bacteroidetes bacterium]|nr:4'-phosphopantetheinyl transferase superfamily protein [Bacteroidota bacterium]